MVVEILANRNQTKSDVDTKKVDLFIHANLKNLADNDRIGEAAWMLFLAKVLRITVRVSDIKLLTQFNSSVCALILCDLETRGLLSGPLDKSHWNKFLNDAGLMSEMWLYAYEASRKMWTGKPNTFVSLNKQFAELFKCDISFYNENKNFIRVDKKIAIERRNREKENVAFKQSLDEATLELLMESDESGITEFQPMIIDDSYMI